MSGQADDVWNYDSGSAPGGEVASGGRATPARGIAQCGGGDGGTYTRKSVIVLGVGGADKTGGCADLPVRP